MQGFVSVFQVHERMLAGCPADLVSTPVNREYSIPYDLLYSLNAPEDVLRFCPYIFHRKTIICDRLQSLNIKLICLITVITEFSRLMSIGTDSDSFQSV